MNFIRRALSGLFLIAISLGLTGLGVWRIHSSINADDTKNKRPAKERAYVVDTNKFQPETIKPKITAFGEVKAWRKLEIRAAASGPIIKIAADFRDGATVGADEMLFEIDPETANRRVTDSKTALLQAEAELHEAKANLDSLQSEIENTEKQLALKRSDLKRKQDLRDRRLITQPVYDEVALAVSTYEQTLSTNRQALFAGEIRVKKAENDIERAKISLADAERALKDTSYSAPFAGRLTEATATLGRRVTENEKLGVLIDPRELEVAFRIRDDIFGRLITYGKGQKITPLPIKAEIDLGDRIISVGGTLDRLASVTDPNQGGRTVFARLDNAEHSVLRPGDFVTVTIEEPELDQVAIVPARALTQDGNILVIGKDSRLENVQAKILRRQGDDVIISDIPFGRQYVKMRLPYLAEGVKVTSRGLESEKNQPKTDSTSEMISLSNERRKVLIAAVMSNKHMPEDRKKNILVVLNKDAAPRELIERLEQRLKTGRGRS